MSSEKKYSASGKYNAVVTEHYEWGGRGPKRCQAKLATWITPRDGEPRPGWETATLITWSGELPTVGEPIELIATFVVEVYNGKLTGQYSLVNSRPGPIPQSHASVPLEGGRRNTMPTGDTRPVTQDIGDITPRREMPPGATPTQYGPPDAGAYDLRDEAPPPTDADRGDWGF